MKKEDTYEQCFHASSNGILVTDKNGSIIDINEQAERILDINSSQVNGGMITDFLPITGKEVLECLRTKKTKLGIHLHEQKVEHVLDINIIDKDSAVFGAVCTFQEMSQFEFSARKLESYKKLNKQFEAIFDSSSDGIWVLNKNGEVISINKAAEIAEGFKKENVIGKKIDELLKKGIVDQAVTPQVLRSKKKVSKISYRERTKKTLLVTGTPVLDEDDNIYMVVVNERDMTELTELKEKLESSDMVTEKIKDELSELTLQGLKENKIIAESKEMQNILDVSVKLARIEASNILILGESGTGKSLLAKFIHSTSRRSRNPIIEINCAAVPENLLEAELFGYEKGAFTGAGEQGKAGLFELAHEGTLFLDEIGDMPLSLQAKLLKYLDDKKIMRLGGTKSRRIDCIVIAATNQNLGRKVKEKKFRNDLFYRLNAFTLSIPPLRERPEDTFEVVTHYLNKYNKMYAKKTKIGSEAMALLQEYHFPGNVRELKNLIKKGVVLSDEARLDGFLQECISNEKITSIDTIFTIKEKKHLSLTDELFKVERRILMKAMQKCRSTSELALKLNISQPTAFRKMRRHNLQFKNE